PKRMNKLGSSGSPGSGSFLYAEPMEENDALDAAAHAAEHRALTALKEHQDSTSESNGSNGSSNGSSNGHR
ncbi:MAG: cytochrome b, partial [Actinomycetia bacterium]|nr:cytochrome b [Actinomycetes bacterium]